MKIIINEMPIDFQLEDERTAGSVVSGVTEWLITNNHIVDEISVNGTVRNVDDDRWRSIPVEKTEEIRISARSRHQDRVERLETLISYTALLRRVMLEGDDEQVLTVLEELPFVIEGIKTITPDLQGLLEEPLSNTDNRPPNVDQDRSGDQSRTVFRTVPDEETRHRMAARAAELGVLFENRQRELVDPEHEMALTLTLLDELLPSFEDIPGELQEGKEKSAMDTVTRFTEVAGRMLRILPRIAEVRPALQSESVEDEPLEDAIEGIHNLLAELENAFQTGDYVLIGDLLEYEALPRFSALSTTVARHLNSPR